MGIRGSKGAYLFLAQRWRLRCLEAAGTVIALGTIATNILAYHNFYSSSQVGLDNLSKLSTLDICIIKATPLAQLTKKPKYIIFAVIKANIKKALVLKKYTNPAIKVLVEYYNRLEVFLQKEADKLLEH